MTITMVRKQKMVACGVLAAFALLVLPVGEYAEAATLAPGNGALSGFIFGQDMRTPVIGAVVKIRSLKDQKELASQPTDSNGVFMIPDIPEGQYLLGVTSGKSDFNFDYSLSIKAGELGKLSVALAAGARGQEPSAEPARPKKAGFFNSVAGRALLVTVVGVGVYFLFFNETSPDRR